VATEIEFGLLGPLEVRRRGAAVTVPQGKQQVILAMLLLNAGRAVRVDELADTLWEAGAPPSGSVAVQNYVMRLRNTLGDIGRARIITQSPGYLIRVQAGELDLSRFEALVGAARAAARGRSWDQAAARAREALMLWRGEPLAAPGCEALAARETPRLAELRLEALELRIDADLHLGRHAAVIADLRHLTGAHPLRERLHGQLMLALYRDGQQAEALAAYRHARDALVTQLGVEPGPGLRDLHQQILSADPALAATGPAPGECQRAPRASRSPRRPARTPPQPDPPRQLPPTVAGFTGRVTELDTLTRILNQAGGNAPGTVVISAIGGTAGVGKTALALFWAHRVADRFPDGQLYVNLRGYDPGQPVAAADVLARFLRALGVPGQDIPPDEDERADRYRSRLAGKRMLIVLDNARSAGQVRPLLPGTPSCAVVVTSRDALAGLVARDGAARLDLDLLPPRDAVGLLRALIGARVDAEPEAAALLAERCSRLPLALRVAAELAGARSDVPLASLVGELADQQQRLSLLDAGGDPGTSVRTVFSWSYRHLDTRAARAFRLAGLHPGADFGPHAVAALTSATLEESRGVLDVLARAYLVQRAGPGRYGLHDLLRAYARELADAHDDKDRDAALTRLLDHYLHSAAAAMDALYPSERDRRPRVPPGATPAPPVTEPTAAQAWLDAERANLVAVTAHAAGHGWPAHATRLAATLFRYLADGSHSQEAITIYAHARAAARQAGDHAAEATALGYAAGVHWQQSHYQQAADHLQQALALSQQAGDRGREADTLANLGVIRYAQGRYQEASTLIAQALDTFRQAGDRFGEMRCLGNLGNVEERQGRYQQAARHHRQALSIAREIDASYMECPVLISLGTAVMRQGELQQAAGYLGQALSLAQEAGNRYHQAEALTRTGDVLLRQGSLREACDHIQEALALYQEIGDRSGEAGARNSLGEALLAAGQPSHARTHHTTARDIARDIGDEYQQARAHDGLAHAHHTLARPDEARDHWRKALALYTRLGTPEADQVRAQLADAEDGAGQSSSSSSSDGSRPGASA
jgi:DNA-binding SARP family transcriptional activator/Tfp pilus assembly protein PilF